MLDSQQLQSLQTLIESDQEQLMVVLRAAA